jgi:hypothetical protein
MDGRSGCTSGAPIIKLSDDPTVTDGVTDAPVEAWLDDPTVRDQITEGRHNRIAILGLIAAMRDNRRIYTHELHTLDV